MKNFSFIDMPILLRQTFYTTAMVYDRREQEPFPPVNIYFCGEKIIVQALIPGVELKDIKVSIINNSLILEGCIHREKGYYIHEERYSGHYKRKIIFDNMLKCQYTVKIKDGILQINLQQRT